MRFNSVFITSWLAVSLVLGSGAISNKNIERRQQNSGSAFPTLGSEKSETASITITSTPPTSNPQTNHPAATTTESSSISESTPPPVSTTHNGNNTSIISSTSLSSSIIPTSTSSAGTNVTSGAEIVESQPLPLPPHITPALSIGGVTLILTGIVYALIGVKNRWVHIFLSTAYLTSLSITVLIVYVLNPPVSNAIQGAYFVGIFMTGIIFGAGALVFKEVTEGLGCMLGGFCLSMWFMTLKEGGLIQSTGGKAIFISAFCVVAWSLSFSHYTRPYGLIGSIAFSGATAFVLGIDCFSRGGLKEFWLFIWNLNDNIFPLNTNTYPITRGTRVESIVIVLACIIGVVSQMKLWKVIKDRQNRKNAEEEEEQRRRDAVEAALGRHLERQNDRDRSEWEKQYGNRLNAKRETVLWTDAHGEKGYSKIRETEIAISQGSSSSESLEMTPIPRQSRSMYVTRIKRQSSMPVTSIPEVEEGDSADKLHTRKQALGKLEGTASTSDLQAESSPIVSPAASPRPEDDTSGFSAAVSTENISRERSPAPSDQQEIARLSTSKKRNSTLSKYLSAPDADATSKKRRSFTSLFSRSPKLEDDIHSTSPSQEALVVIGTPLRHSRASSLAATLDFENEVFEPSMIDIDIAHLHEAPEIFVSPVDPAQKTNAISQHPTIREVPTEPELEEENLDLDPEEFVRPVTRNARPSDIDRRVSLTPSLASRRQSGSEVGTEILYEGVRKTTAADSETSQNEILTKGALELVPNQLSHVVMSYRTNEWAKHIAAADAPLYEEPEPFNEEDQEVPTQLADPTSPMESKRSSLSQQPPPEIAAPVPSALPSTTEGIRVNPAIQYEQAPISAVVLPAPPIPPSQPTRIRSTSDGGKIPRGLRSTSTPMLVKQGVQTTPTLESTKNGFAPSPIITRSSSGSGLNQLDNAPLPPLPTFSRPGTAHSNYGGLQRTGSRYSLISEAGVIPARSNSQLSQYQQMNPYQQGPYQHYSGQQGPYQQVPPKSETRLQGYDSHQPLRRNTSVENQRREAMFADWRVGQQQRMPDHHDPTEYHRQQMLMERQQIKMLEDHEKNYKWQQEIATDARMRTRDMQELHREAMRKMQAGVNKKMTN